MRVKNLLSDLKTRILIIDEIHHVLAGSPEKTKNIFECYQTSL